MDNGTDYNIISQNVKILEILKNIDRIAESDCSVLLTGETGTGKEIFAEYIHQKSSRSNRPLIKIGLSTLSPQLIESELFGHEKGAFTGSIDEKKGLFEFADKGTIFLDDIDDFPYDLQPKLLRVLENREIKRIGGRNTIPLDIRLITSTKIDLQKLVSQQKFRSDLFFRINIFPIVIPSLRERADDIPLLVRHFLKYYEPDKDIRVSESAMNAMLNYSWPGNVRELRNIIQRISLFVNGRISLENLPEEISNRSNKYNFFKKCPVCINKNEMNFEEVMACVESHLLRYALKSTDGNRTQAARMLSLSLSTFRDKLRKHNLDNHSPVF